MHDENQHVCCFPEPFSGLIEIRMETMHFMDPRQRRRHFTRLMVGYGLVGCAIVMITVVLLFIAYGYGYKDGKVIRSGLMFLSSMPHPADVYIDGRQYRDTTNARLVLPEGSYALRLHRDGYRDWRHTATVIGGEVVSYVYPLLFPDALTTSTVHEYAAAPVLTTQSVDRRWLLVAHTISSHTFDLYDLQHPKQASQSLKLPDGLMTTGGTQSLEPVAWSADDASVLLGHGYGSKKYEYILLNRTAPSKSVNLTKLLSLPAGDVDMTFVDNKHDQFWVLQKSSHLLGRASIQQPTVRPYLTGVLAFTASGPDTVLYITPDTSESAKVDIELRDNGQTNTIRRAPAGATYLLGMRQYAGDLYMAMSNTGEDTAYVYKNPVQQITDTHLGVAVPVRMFHMPAPDYLAFGPSGQYVVFQHGSSVAVYDAELAQGTVYTLPVLDKSETHMTWLDNARLAYVNGGQLVVADYDGTNRQTLVAADARYQPYVNTDYKTLYVFMPAASNTAHELLTSTSLLTPADQ